MQNGRNRSIYLSNKYEIIRGKCLGNVLEFLPEIFFNLITTGSTSTLEENNNLAKESINTILLMMKAKGCVNDQILKTIEERNLIKEGIYYSIQPSK